MTTKIANPPRTTKRNWKEMRRHPLSAEYPDITGRAWERYVENLKAFGIVRDRKIVLFDGKVVDGWQLYRGCIEADIKPEFEKLKLPKGMTIEGWVETVNDLRRHESQEKAMKRAEERRERVITARQEGKSLRAIAEEEGIGVPTVRRDLEASGVPGGTPEASNGKVAGKDGKAYPAAQYRSILCDRCQRVGAVKDCQACKDARKPPKASNREPGEDDVPLNSNGKPMPTGRGSKPGKPVFDDRKVIDIFGKLVRTLSDRAIAYGLKDMPKDCKQPLNQFLEAFKTWQKS